jgi:hypothetical protein
MKIICWKVKNGKVTTGSDILFKAGTVVIPLSIIAQPTDAYAAKSVGQAMQPIINALQDLAEPVCYAFMIFGGIKYMSGHSTEGQKILKNAVGGYVLIRWIPWIFEIIKGIGAE